MPSSRKTKVYFDGACHLCSREIDAYRKIDSSGALDLIDISKKNFDAEKLGLDRQEVQRVFHVQSESGEIVTGIDAFVNIWKRLGIFKLGVFLLETEPSRSIGKLGYSVFAALRPLLPKKSCKDDQCQIK